MKYEVLIDKTFHAEARKNRPDYESITDEEMIELVERSAKNIIKLLTSDKIDNREKVLVRDKKSHLNVVVGINTGEKLKLIIVTAMKKENFVDNGENAAVIDL